MRITESQLRKVIKEQLQDTAVQPEGTPAQAEPEFYLLGYWSNAYSRGSDKEYFWSGPFETREEAQEFGQMKQRRGQPKRFIDWGKGRNMIFSSLEGFLAAARKVGMNPRISQ